MKTIAVIQARMGSSRLPEKSLKPLNNKSLLANVVLAAKKNDFIDEIIVATTNQIEDNAIEKACKDLGIKFERGDAENVLSRFINIAKRHNDTDQIVRVTADNPINNTKATKYLFEKHLASNADYTCVDGLSHTVYEVVKVEALLRLDQNKSLDKDDKEHVTKYIREHPDEFKVQKINPDVLEIQKDLDKLLTIDTKQDYQRFIDLSHQFDFNNTIDFSEIYKYLNQSVNA